MGTKNIRKAALSAVLLLAAPAVMALSYYGGDSSSQVLKLDSSVAITDNQSKLNLSLRDSDVKQVLRMFADKAGLNIVFHNSVSGTVTLDLVNVSLNDAFKLVLQITGLTYYMDGNTLIIASKSDKINESFASKEMTVLPVKYVDASEIAKFLNKNIYAKKRIGLSTTEIATVNTATNELIIFGMQNDVDIAKKIIDQFDRKLNSATFVVNHTTPAEMASLVCNMLSPGSATVSGEQVNIENEDGGSTGFAADDEEEADESTGGQTEAVKLGENYTACTLNGTVSVGSAIPFNPQSLKVTYYPQRGTVKVFGGSQAQIDMIGDFIKENDVKQPQALVELSILELTEDGSKEFSNIWNVAAGDMTYTFNGENGTTIAHVSKSQGTKIGWNMSYIISNNKGRILANPKLLVTNGKESVIDLTSDYVETVDVEFVQTSTSTAPLSQKTYNIGSDQGLKVAFTPFISPDGYVTMNIIPEYSTESEKVYGTEYDESGATQEYLAATLLARRNLDIKNVRIKDGETLIIGGLIQETTQKTVSKVPILGDIPGIGAAFRNTQSQKVKTELVIMVTPKIIKDNEDVGINSL